MPDDHGSNHLPALTSDMSPTPCSHKGLTSRNLALGTSRNFVSFIKYFFNYERKSPEPCGFGLLLGHPLFRSVGTGCYGSGTWIRTMIHGFKGRCPAIRRSRITTGSHYSGPFRSSSLRRPRRTSMYASAVLAPAEQNCLRIMTSGRSVMRREAPQKPPQGSVFCSSTQPPP